MNLFIYQNDIWKLFFKIIFVNEHIFKRLNKIHKKTNCFRINYFAIFYKMFK